MFDTPWTPQTITFECRHCYAAAKVSGKARSSTTSSAIMFSADHMPEGWTNERMPGAGSSVGLPLFSTWAMCPACLALPDEQRALRRDVLPPPAERELPWDTDYDPGTKIFYLRCGHGHEVHGRGDDEDECIQEAYKAMAIRLKMREAAGEERCPACALVAVFQ